MKILIYLAVWQRPEITEMCFKSIKRLKAHPEHEIEALAVISEDSMINLCEAYGIKWCYHENTPLGQKKNFGLQVASTIKFDWLMEIGSDDIVLSELLDDYKKFFEKYDFIGLQEMLFMDSSTGKCVVLDEPITYGAGRMISRKALEHIGFKLWTNGIDRGLDNDSVIRMYRAGYQFWQIPKAEIPRVMDIKSDVNIWKFDRIRGNSFDSNLFINRLSADEQTYLKCLLSEKKELA